MIVYLPSLYVETRHKPTDSFNSSNKHIWDSCYHYVEDLKFELIKVFSESISDQNKTFKTTMSGVGNPMYWALIKNIAVFPKSGPWGNELFQFQTIIALVSENCKRYERLHWSTY